MVGEVDEIGTIATELVDHAWRVDGSTVSVSLVCAVGSVETYRQASRLLAPLKKRAKEVGRSGWVLGRPKSDRVDVPRGRVMSAGV